MPESGKNAETIASLRSVLEQTHSSASNRSNSIHYYAFKGAMEDVRFTARLLRNLLDRNIFDTPEDQREAETSFRDLKDLEAEFCIELKKVS